jgi:hypothetical protein
MDGDEFNQNLNQLRNNFISQVRSVVVDFEDS